MLLLQTVFDGKMYCLKIKCAENYPCLPPVVHFVHKIKLTGVNATNGLVSIQIPPTSVILAHVFGDVSGPG